MTPRQRAWTLQALHVAVPGRARARLPSAHGGNGLASEIADTLLGCEGIRDVDIRCSTGTVIVHYDPAIPADRLLDAAQSRLFSLARVEVESGTAPAARSRPAPRVRRASMKHQGQPPGSEQASSAGTRPAHWQTLTVAQCLQALGSGPAGLAAAEAYERRIVHGLNEIPEQGPTPAWAMISDQLATAPVALLAGSAGIALLTGGLVDALAIGAVVAINTIIGYGTERQSERIIRSLSVGSPDRVHVFREGEEVSLRLAEIVPGDVLRLRPGAYVAADARLIHCQTLSMDESALTGESMPVAKSADAVCAADTPLAERTNMIFRGTVVTGGSALAAVVETGLQTELGRIQLSAEQVTTPETPMEQQLGDLGGQLAAASVAACAAVFGLGILRRMPLLDLMKSSASLGVAAVPEGLPAVATTTLALGIREMRKHKAAVRRLSAVEGLGSIDLLCLDKTGTLTQNRMTVSAVFSGDRRLSPAPGGLVDAAGEKVDGADATLRALLQTIALCNDSSFSKEVSLQGSPTENALLQIVVDCGVDVDGLRKRHGRLDTIHRAESRHYMATVHRGRAGKRLLAIKGSPSDVLARCRWIRRSARRRRLSDDDMARARAENERLAGLGMRVLGVARATVGDNKSVDDADLEWLGLVAMVDPLRPRMKSLIRDLHAAGIDTVMITGDQSATAQAVAEELDLSGGRQLKILESTHLKGLDPELLGALAEETQVFARVTPAHKLEIVQALQRKGRVVGMTGDGINDGPALKAANVGIAMGSGQQDVARSVADVVIEDDNLATLLEAVSQGRTIYTNIRKSLHFLLSTNFSEIEVMLAGLALGLPQPLTAMQLLWINLVTDIFPGLALAVEPADPDVLARPPRDPEEPILSGSNLLGMVRESAVITAGTLSAYGYGLVRYGPGARAGTLAFNTLTTAQLLHAFSCRSTDRTIFERRERPVNRSLRLAVGGSLALQAATVAVPPLRRLVNGTGVGLIDAAMIAFGATGPLIVNELLKLRRRRAQDAEQQNSAGDPAEGLQS
mgnify:CR=1 FL=1